MSYLEVHDLAGTRWLPTGQYFTIGRSLANHVVLRGQAVSRSHARIILQDGGAALEDLGSTYGTMVNGLYIRGWKPLHDEDRIQMGDALVIYHDERDRASVQVTSPAGAPPTPGMRPPPTPRTALLPRNMLHCPHCGTPNLKSNSVCYACGSHLLPARNTARPAGSPAAGAHVAQRRRTGRAPRAEPASPTGTLALLVLLVVVVCLLSLLMGIILANGPIGLWLSGALAR